MISFFLSRERIELPDGLLPEGVGEGRDHNAMLPSTQKPDICWPSIAVFLCLYIDKMWPYLHMYTCQKYIFG